MAGRSLNNIEKEGAAALKKAGFHIFWFQSGLRDNGSYWATHPKLIGQYHIETSWRDALDDLSTGRLHRQTNKQPFTMDDFEQGLMLAGLVTPASVKELHEREALNEHSCPKCGDTGRYNPTLAEPDGQECDCLQL